MNVIQRIGVSAKDRDLAPKWVKHCLLEITREDYELPVDYGEARNDLVFTVKRTGHRSSACAKGITIDTSEYAKGSSTLLEYPAFAHDPVIGSRNVIAPELVLAGTIAHDVSHFVQYRYGPDTRRLKNRYRKPHGEGFRDIYRILRSKVVNPHLQDV